MLRTENHDIISSGNGSDVRAKPFPIQVANQDIVGGDPQTVAEEYVNSASETYDINAFIDTSLQMDIDSIKMYTRRSAATVIAVANGNFSSALTWWNVSTGGQDVPGPGDNVLVPQGVTVTYDQESSTVYGTIRIDGGWEYASDRNVELHCDTIFVDHTGTYSCASKASPAPDTYTQKVVYHDNGPLDVSFDMMKMQRGLICFGRAGIYATPVIFKTRSVGDIQQGATSVTLDRAVMGQTGFRDWKAGDEIVIAGTRMRGHCNNWEEWEHEVRTISGIDNSNPAAPVVSWDTPLSYPHPACFRDATLTPHVINRTRNFRTWTDGIPADAQRRAHQLFKNKDQNEVEYVEAFGMGRTDMDYITLQEQPVRFGGMPMITSTTNTIGRYIWHFHRNGANDPTLNPSIFRGCVGYDSPGWVFVHHDSRGHIIDCFAMDYQAVGFAGEGGGTWGSFDNCVAIGNRETWKGPSNNAIKTGGLGLGAIGHGFWINSRPLNVKNCVAVDCTVGFGWTSRVHLGSDLFPIITDPAGYRAYYGLATLSDVTLQKTFATIEGFESNEAYSCNWGGSVAKKFPVQHHDLISFFDGFTAWEVDTGFHWQYTGMYSLKDFKVIGFDPSGRTPGQPPYNPDIGLWPYRQTVGMTFISPRVDGFSRGISFTVQGGANTAENKAHKVIDPVIVNCNKVYTNDGTEITLPWSTSANNFVDVEELSLSQLGDSSAGAIVPGYTEDSCYWSGSGSFVIAHDFWYTDSVGFQNRQRGVPNAQYGWGLFVNGQDEARTHAQISKDASVCILISRLKLETMIQQQGVWTSAAGDKVLLIPDVIQDRSSSEFTYFFTPCALRMPAGQFAGLNPTENGTLGIHTDVSGIVQDFTDFNPAGTPGLT